MKIFNKVFIIFAVISIGILVPKNFMINGVNDLPIELKDYGNSAINFSENSLDNPIERIFFVKNFKVVSVQIDKDTGELLTQVRVRGIFGINYANVYLKGNIYDEKGNIHDKSGEMGYTESYIERYFLNER